MLELKDLFHLSQLDAIVEQVVAPAPGCIVVAGLDPRPTSLAISQKGFLPSGRQTIFRMLVRQMLSASPGNRAIIVSADRQAFRVPRQFRRQVTTLFVDPPLTYAGLIADAVRRQPTLLVIDRLNIDSATDALQAAQKGIQVLSQIDTIFVRGDVVRHLHDMGVPQGRLSGLNWVIAVSRVAALCAQCKQPVHPTAGQLGALCRRFALLDGSLESGTFFKATGCRACQYTGRAGDVAVFDIYKADSSDSSPFRGQSLLSREAYLLELAAQGQVPLDAVDHISTEQLRQTYHMLAASERSRAETHGELQRKLAELEAANQVLQDRTEALISLYDIGQALITSTTLDELAVRLCRRTHDLCGADRAVLYYVRPDEKVEILAVNGWDPALVHQQFDVAQVFGANQGTDPTPYPRWPPGIPPRHPDVEGAALRAGLRVPLIAQGSMVGLMIVHTTFKQAFTPGEVALLQTFATQAAVAIQRAGLIQELQGKISQLEAAQAGLVEKERMEREMELARQVQQSVLPHVFPLMPGYRFGAYNQPARRVGGDFYDVIMLDGDRFGIVIADVSDKGMPAALYMALTRSLILAEARRDPSPRAVLNNVHRLLLELGEPDMFVTVFYGVVDGPTRRLTYVRAGHDLPILLREGKAKSLRGEGTFLGFPDLDELHLSEEELTLAPGDRLVLYTDGLIDILSPASERFGLGRLTSTLESLAHSPPDELCAVTFSELAAHQGNAEQYDDMTLLVVAVE